MDATITPDVWRYIGLAMAVSVVAIFPLVAFIQGRMPSAWIAVIGTEILFIHVIFAVLDHLGEPMVWYRTPVVIVACLAFYIYFAVVLVKERDPGRRTF